jgi:hypothetical protein
MNFIDASEGERHASALAARSIRIRFVQSISKLGQGWKAANTDGLSRFLSRS